MKTITSKTIRLNSRLDIEKKKSKIKEHKVKDSCFQKEIHAKIEFFNENRPGCGPSVIRLTSFL